MTPTSISTDRRDLLRRLGAAPDRVARAARAAKRRAVPDGEWSAREIVLHLVAVENEVFQRRLRQLAEEIDPHWTWTEPGVAEGPGTETVDDALALFETSRRRTLDLVAGLDEAGWARSGTHATYGVLDVAGLLRVAADHDDDHLATLER
jgi:hypothetical protein